MMGETTKISILFWTSGIAVVLGLLLANMSVPAAIITVGAMGLAFSLGWFIMHLRDAP